MLKKFTLIALLLFGFCRTVYATNDTSHYSSHYDGVLGTSFDVSIYDVDQTRAKNAITETLQEIKRLEAILSTWQADSQISQLNAQGKGDNVANELFHVVEQCEQWRTASNSKFSCRMGKIKLL